MSAPAFERVSTGVDGLDEVLCGGLVRDRTYLVRGGPGTGKTTLGFHFLAAGLAADETGLFVAAAERPDDAAANAARLGLDLAGVEWLDLAPRESGVQAGDGTADATASATLTDRLDAVAPDRVFVDGASRLPALTDQAADRSLTDVLAGRDATTLLAARDDATAGDLRYRCDGIVTLHHDGDRRTLAVPKVRGSDRLDGTHGLGIGGDGMTVFPALVPDEHTEVFDTEPIPSGTLGFDALLDGGIERGTVTVVSGPPGTGKTTIGSLFVTEAARRGDRAAVYLFDETAATYRHRAGAVGLPVADLADGDALTVEQVEPLRRSPEAFAQQVRHEVERRGTRVVMLDGLPGYELACGGDEALARRRLHALCRHLTNLGVTVLLVDEVPTLAGDSRATAAGVSSLADNVVVTRYRDRDGERRTVVGVLKKRVGEFERTVRELDVSSQGVQLSEPLDDTSGVFGSGRTSGAAEQ